MRENRGEGRWEGREAAMTGRLNETHLLGNSYSVFIPSNLNHHFVCWPVSQDPCKVGGHLPRASPELGGVDRAMAMPNTGDGGPWGHPGQSLKQSLVETSSNLSSWCYLFCSDSGNFFLIKKAAGLQKNNR